MISLGPGLLAHASGALWLPESGTAIAADVHLGYSWAQRRRGELGPLADFRARRKLFALMDELMPRRVVFLGDLVHAPRPGLEEREWLEATLSEVASRATLVAVRGNHDRAFAREFGHLAVQVVESWSEGALTAVHGDRLSEAPVPEGTLLVGHLHPCLGVLDAAGASQKIPVFLANRHCVVLPAFSPFARGYDITCGLPAELHARFGGAPIEAYAASATRVVRLGGVAQAVEKMFEADKGAAVQFRRRSAR